MEKLPPYADFLGLSVTRGADNALIFAMPFGEAVVGRPGYLHGGAIAGLLEIAAFGTLRDALGPESGATIKLINNFVCGTQVAALAEAMAMIERSGLDRTQAVDVLLSGAPGSPLVKLIAGRMTAADYTPNFFLALLAKDLGYAIQEAGALSLDLTTAATARKLFERAIAAGHGDQDMAAVVEPLRK